MDQPIQEYTTAGYSYYVLIVAEWIPGIRSFKTHFPMVLMKVPNTGFWVPTRSATTLICTRDVLASQ